MKVRNDSLTSSGKRKMKSEDRSPGHTSNAECYSETLRGYLEKLREETSRRDLASELAGLDAILSCCMRMESPAREQMFVEAVLALEQAEQLLSLRKAA